MQNTQKTAQTAQSPTIETITLPHELAERLNNAAYFYGEAIEHITHTFLPSIALANQCGDTALVSQQLKTLENYILQYTEQYHGIAAAIDFNTLEAAKLLPRGSSKTLAQAEMYQTHQA